MQQVDRNAFFVDVDGDGMLSSEAELATFIETRSVGQPAAMWVRTNVAVGRRVSALADTP
jgi:hypothetical protein